MSHRDYGMHSCSSLSLQKKKKKKIKSVWRRLWPLSCMQGGKPTAGTDSLLCVQAGYLPGRHPHTQVTRLTTLLPLQMLVCLQLQLCATCLSAARLTRAGYLVMSGILGRHTRPRHARKSMLGTRVTMTPA